MQHGTLSKWAGTPLFGLILMWGCSSGLPTEPDAANVIVPTGKGIGSEVFLPTPSHLCSDYTPETIATFEDGELEAVVRAELGINSQVDLTCELAAAITALDAESCPCDGRQVSSLVGIQNLTSLRALNLNGNPVSDLSPLSGLTSLQDFRLGRYGSPTLSPVTDINALNGLTSLIWLELSGNTISDVGGLSEHTELRYLDLGRNEISEISALSGLTLLTHLDLSGNTITDIGALSGMTRLGWLELHDNNIADISALSLMSLTTLLIHANEIVDISALSGQTFLTRLMLSFNQITDVTALQGLTSLAALALAANSDLTNIQPLLDNTGIGVGDEVRLEWTAVDCGQVEKLRQKGVILPSPFSRCL